MTPPEIRGAAFGLRQTLDTIGAFLGPLIAALLLLMWTTNIQHIFWIAVIPGVGAVALLVFGLKEPEHKTETKKRTNPIALTSLRQLSGEYWWVVLIGMAFTLARFSEAFLVLLANQYKDDLGLAAIPLVMVVMSVVYAATAYPFGALSDRFSHRLLLTLGLAVLIVADFVLGLSSSVAMLFVGITLWGVHMGMTEGLLSVMISKSAPAELRGTAFGFFGLIRGIMTVFASVLAGAIWHYSGSTATFLTGAAFAGVAFTILIVKRKKSF
jgi:MFS family permease